MAAVYSHIVGMIVQWLNRTFNDVAESLLDEVGLRLYSLYGTFVFQNLS